MSRFEDAPQQVIDFVGKVREVNFPELDGALIKVMFDGKKRKAGGRLVLGRIKSSNDELKSFAIDINGNPYDYILFLDRLVYDNISEKDRERLIFHELCHCKTDFESNTNQYKVCDHEINTFYAEIEANRDDPQWLERVSTIAASLYDPDADGPTTE